MINILSMVISGIILIFVYLKTWATTLQEHVDFTKKKTYIFILFMYVALLLINFFVTSSLKLILVFLIGIITCAFLFENNLSKKIMAVFFTQVLFIISELVFVYVGYYLLNIDLEKIADVYTGTFIINLIVSILVIVIFKCLCKFKIERKVINLVDKINAKYIIVLLSIVMLITNLIIYTTYYRLSSTMFLMLNTFTIVVYLIITYKFLDEQNKNLFIKIEYDNLSDKSVEYEKIIDNNRRDIHENKNDLIVLDGLISKRNTKAKKQIEAMIKDYTKLEKELKGNDELYRLTLPIPSGGLRGLVYHKLLMCEQLKVNYDLRIGRDVNSKVVKNIDFHTMRKFVKIVGIYLDNAIDATKAIKNKEINIEFFLEEGYFCVLISNTFSGTLDIEKMGTMGYTSKGGKHGYGLSLAKEILSEDKNLVSETSIYKNIMSQVIKVKM